MEMPDRRLGWRSQRGSGLVVVAIGSALAAVLMLALVVLGDRVIDGSRAQAAADAAALAGVVEGRSAAAELAGSNGARLVSFDEVAGVVRVVVEVDGRRAEATAERTVAATRGG